MEVIRTQLVAREECDAARAAGKSLGFVPTMGFFHQGHLSLMHRARRERDAVVVSIFVNPLQFGPKEDFHDYPRDLERDLGLAESVGVDLVFAPDVEEMYSEGEPEVTVDPGPPGERLEGASRPGHFRGVATVVAKLFHVVGACTAYFGEKDAQQLALIKRMVEDLSFPVAVAGCPTVREEDGLAMSSRNAYLSPAERKAATCLYRGLTAARDALHGGERRATELRELTARTIEEESLAQLDYAAVVDEISFEEVDEVREPARALVAARVGSTRLIDNMLLRPGVGENEWDAERKDR